jgi:hypothetical protein
LRDSGRSVPIASPVDVASRRHGGRPAPFVALFEIVGEREVAVCAVRHQREDDYH